MRTVQELTPEVVEELASTAWRSLMLIGGSDKGKTTLVEALCRLLRDRSAAIVDLDAGQSRVGPPTTVAWGLIPADDFSWDRIRAQDIYFTGATSPVGNMLPTLAGAGVISRAAAARAEQIVVDTSGLIRGPGVALKRAKLDLIKPDVVVVLEQGTEAEPIIRGLRGQDRPRLMRLRPPAGVRDKTPAERAAYRAGSFRRYFAAANKTTFDLDRLGLGGASASNLARNTDDQLHRLVGLRDTEGKDLALGLIAKLEPESGRVTILSPITEPERVRTLIFGRMRLTPDGRQQESIARTRQPR